MHCAGSNRRGSEGAAQRVMRVRVWGMVALHIDHGYAADAAKAVVYPGRDRRGCCALPPQYQYRGLGLSGLAFHRMHVRGLMRAHLSRSIGLVGPVIVLKHVPTTVPQEHVVHIRETVVQEQRKLYRWKSSVNSTVPSPAKLPHTIMDVWSFAGARSRLRSRRVTSSRSRTLGLITALHQFYSSLPITRSTE